MSKSDHQIYAKTRNNRLLIMWVLLLIIVPVALLVIPPHSINWAGLVIFDIAFTILIVILRLIHYNSANKLERQNNSPT